MVATVEAINTVMNRQEIIYSRTSIPLPTPERENNSTKKNSSLAESIGEKNVKELTDITNLTEPQIIISKNINNPAIFKLPTESTSVSSSPSLSSSFLSSSSSSSSSSSKSSSSKSTSTTTLTTTISSNSTTTSTTTLSSTSSVISSSTLSEGIPSTFSSSTTKKINSTKRISMSPTTIPLILSTMTTFPESGESAITNSSISQHPTKLFSRIPETSSRSSDKHISYSEKIETLPTETINNEAISNNDQLSSSLVPLNSSNHKFDKENIILPTNREVAFYENEVPDITEIHSPNVIDKTKKLTLFHSTIFPMKKMKTDKSSLIPNHSSTESSNLINYQTYESLKKATVSDRESHLRNVTEESLTKYKAMGKGNNHKVPTKIPKQKKLIVSSSSYYNDLFNYTEPITPFLNITTSIMMTQKPQFKEVSTSSLDVSSTSKKKDSITFTPISQFPIIECLNCSRHHHDNFSNSTTQEHRQNTTINNLLLFNDFPDTTTLYDQYDNYGKFLTNSPIREPEENLLPNFYEANLHKPNNISPTPRRQFQFTRNPTNLSVFTFPFSYAIQRENIEGKRSTISQFNSHRFNEYSSSKRVNGFASTTAEYEVNLNDYNKFKEKFKEKGKFVDETFPHQSTTTTTYDFPIETDDKLPIFHNVKNEPDNWPIKPSITTLNKSSEMNNNFFNFNTTTKTTTTEISPNSRNLFDFLADDRIRMTDSAWLGIYIAGATAFSTLMIIFLIVLGYSHLRRRSHGTYNFLRTFPGELERKSSRFLKQKFRRRFNSNRMVSTETDVSERTSYDVDARPYLLQTSTSSLSQSAKKQRGKSNDEIPSKILKDIPQKPKKRNGKKTKKIESQLQSGTISNCMESNYYTEDNPSIHLSMPQHLHRPTIIPHPSLMPLQYNFPHNQSQNHKLMNGNFIQRFPTSNIHTHQQIIQMNSIPGNIINQLPFHPTSTQNNNQQNYPQHIQMNDYRNNSSNTSSSSSSSTSGLSDDLQNSLSTTDESIVVVQKKQNMFSPSNISRC